MPDYIEREALTNSLDELCDRVCLYSKKNRAVMCGACPLGHAFDLVENIPAANVREVVLCRDCKYREADGCGAIYCRVWDRWEMPGDAFCYRGERRADHV